ncbi:hypothetical protein [Nibrella saemangeumensis]|uniref:hypothetical protein n=1 Tax=Nibrella saemangeumensis TaxID=1084526 RepID=UPI0031EB28A5
MRSYLSPAGTGTKPEMPGPPTQPSPSGPDWLLWLVTGLLLTALLLMGLTNTSGW